MADCARKVNEEDKNSALAQMDEDLSLCNGIDLREITIVDLQKHLSSKMLTSVDIVNYYIKRIKAMDPFLKSVLEINPDAISIAQKMDELRSSGIVLGPLHGIPILLKDNIGTDDKMETTSGSVALIGIKPKEDAEVVKLLRKKGAIILGKTNLSEFACFRGNRVPFAWSSRGSHTKSAYVLSRCPEGSSSGSAVSVSANLVTVSLGTETNGSIIEPSTRASLVGLKVTLGEIPTHGVIPLSFSQDVIGPMTRTVTDAAILFNELSINKLSINSSDSIESYTNFFENISANLKNLTVGVIREPYWNNISIVEELPYLEKVLNIFRESNIQVKDPVDAADGSYEITTMKSEEIVFLHEFKYGLNKYFEEVTQTYEKSSVKSLEDVIKFNIEHPTATDENYDQDLLVKANETDGISNAAYIAEREKNIMAANVYINYIFTKYSLDAVIVPSTNSTLITSVAGLPYITIPVGTKSDNIPFGVTLVGLKHSEEILLQLGYVIEKNLRGRKLPKFLN